MPWHDCSPTHPSRSASGATARFVDEEGRHAGSCLPPPSAARPRSRRRTGSSSCTIRRSSSGPGLVRAISRSLRLTSEHARLTAETADRVAQLRASRRRLAHARERQRALLARRPRRGRRAAAPGRRRGAAGCQARVRRHRGGGEHECNCDSRRRGRHSSRLLSGSSRPRWLPRALPERCTRSSTAHPCRSRSTSTNDVSMPLSSTRHGWSAPRLSQT